MDHNYTYFKILRSSDIATFVILYFTAQLASFIIAGIDLFSVTFVPLLDSLSDSELDVSEWFKLQSDQS